MRCPKSFAIRPRDLPCEILPVSRSGTSVSHCGRTFGRPTGESGHTRRTESRIPARRSACRPWPLTRPLKGGPADLPDRWHADRSEEHTSELQSLMRLSYAVFRLKKKQTKRTMSYHLFFIQPHTYTTTSQLTKIRQPK